jgi:hypothetical protein
LPNKPQCRSLIPIGKKDLRLPARWRLRGKSRNRVQNPGRRSSFYRIFTCTGQVAAPDQWEKGEQNQER